MKILLPWPLSVLFSRRALVNNPKQLHARTIYVSNHPSSFMDPLVIAALTRPSIFFMTRADVFTKITKPLFWGAQMLPIYRQLDGGDGAKKNEVIFNQCAKLLKNGRNLLIFSEGFTDDVFIRRLKPIKKGAVRIGFQSLEKINWKKKIYIQAIGCNYSDPKLMRSDLLISYADKICMNDYKEQYLEDPNKTINELTKEVESLMQEQITHIKDLEIAPFHEQVMKITRKGMNALNFDKAIPLKKRWKYSQSLAIWLNNNYKDLDKLDEIQSTTETYFNRLEEISISESMIFWKKENPKGSRKSELNRFLLLLPLAIIGALHCAIPYLWTKKFTEKTMKRPVFWSSVKLFLGELTIAVFNIILLAVIYNLTAINGWFFVAYFFSIGITGPIAYIAMTHWKRYKEKGRINQMDLSSIIEQRKSLEAKLKLFLPEEFH